MKKYILLLMILFPILFCERASAQDVIKKKSGEIIQAKVLKVDSNKIEYYDLSEVDGPVRTLPIFAISSISYENGSLDVNPSGVYVDGDDLHDSKTGSQFSDDELKEILSPEDYITFKAASIDFNNARRSKASGTYMLIPGGLMLGGGLIVAIIGDNNEGKPDYAKTSYRAGGILLALGGAALTTIGIIKISGKRKIMAKANETMQGVADRYNERNSLGSLTYTPTLSFGITNNGIGLALTF